MNYEKIEKEKTEKMEKIEDDEFWELNNEIHRVISHRIKYIEQTFEREAQNFDIFAKVCKSKYCNKEFKVEEVYLNPNTCPKCGGPLESKYEPGETRANERPEIIESKKILSELKQRLESLPHEIFTYT